MEHQAILHIQLPGQELVELPLDVTWDHFNRVEASNNSGLNAVTITEALWKHCTTFEVGRDDPSRQKIAELEAKVKELEAKLQDKTTPRSSDRFLCRITSKRTKREADVFYRDGLYQYTATVRDTGYREEGDVADADYEVVTAKARDWVNIPMVTKASLGLLVKWDQVRSHRLEVYWDEATGLFTGVRINQESGLTYVTPVKRKILMDSWKDINYCMQGKG